MTKEEYFNEMFIRDRLVTFIDDSNKLRALITFFITNNIDNFNRHKELWNIPNNEDLDGKYIIIDRLITDRKSNIRLNMRELIKYFNLKFPNKQIVYKSRSKNAREVYLKSS